MQQYIIIKPRGEEKTGAKRFLEVLNEVLRDTSCQIISTVQDLYDIGNLKDKRILFAIDLGHTGINLELFRILAYIREKVDFFQNSVAGVLIDGEGELYTKSLGRDLVFTANSSGCMFPGRPLVEGTGSLSNFSVIAKITDQDNYNAYIGSAKGLVQRILAFQRPLHEEPKLLVLHASNYSTSNTIRLWELVKQYLNGIKIKEISLRNGTISDCGGCNYTTCLHFSEMGSCYYGGVIVEQVYPAVEECDALLLLCPNYNDALSANITAFINRLTSLFRKTRFYEKYLFGIIVSGYSGGDILAEQLISGLNMNKTFILPPYFAMLETANAPDSIRSEEGIQERAEAFAENMKKHMVLNYSSSFSN